MTSRGTPTPATVTTPLSWPCPGTGSSISPTEGTVSGTATLELTGCLAPPVSLWLPPLEGRRKSTVRHKHLIVLLFIIFFTQHEKSIAVSLFYGITTDKQQEPNTAGEEKEENIAEEFAQTENTHVEKEKPRMKNHDTLNSTQSAGICSESTYLEGERAQGTCISAEDGIQ